MTTHDQSRVLIKTAIKVRKYAYAPYSNFKVGAAVRTKDGSIYSSANMENASYGLTICAEVGALQAALTAGKFDQITDIAIAGGHRRKIKDSNFLTVPCGRCRQLIMEAAQAASAEIQVWCTTSTGSAYEKFSISELLPHAFGAEQLTKKRAKPKTS